MNLKSIQEKLNSGFKGTERKLVFWYDDNAEFVDEIDTISLENARVYKLTKDNWFYTKYFLENEDKDTNYLIYAPFPKPTDKENHLTDTIYYSKLFYADRISLLCHDLNVPEQFKDYLRKYSKFWNSNERVERFASLGIGEFNNETIDIGVLSVIVGVKTPNFDEVLRKVMIDGELGENKYLSEFVKYGVDSSFWQLCHKYYGFHNEHPNIEKLVVTLLITYTAHSFKGDFPKSWQPYVSVKKNDVVVFVGNIMNNILYREGFIDLAEQISRKLKVKETLLNTDIDAFLYCDAFIAFDELVIDWLTNTIDISLNNVQTKIDILEVIDERSKKYYKNQFENVYKCLENGYYVLKCGSGVNIESGNIIQNYTEDLCTIDQMYRRFYTYFDKLENGSALESLRESVENVYTNTFLSKLSIAWADEIDNYASLDEINHPKQHDFYKDTVRSEAKKKNTVVIISDALRYEVGNELSTRLASAFKSTAHLSSMVSSLPSYTKLGMASLLPNNNVSFKDDFDVLVDEMPTVSTEQRGKILDSRSLNSAALQYDQVISFTRDEIRSVFSGKQLIYIYHNQIDARGDNASTENEVFNACEETFDEIIKVIKKLTSNLSITNYIITADHGFIYKRDKIAESDKVDMPKQKDVYKNKRFIISPEKIEAPGTLSFESLDKYVTVPRGVEIFKTSGGGQNFVHGGASLQELIVPVIQLKTSTAKKETNGAEVVLVSLSRKITNLITFIDFMQSKIVTDTVTAVEIKAVFIDSEGTLISNEIFIHADKKDASPEKRMFREKFTFRNRQYSSGDNYYLVMIDCKSGIELDRIEYDIDIAFANEHDFGF